MIRRLQQDDRRTFPRCGDGCAESAGRGSIDYDIRLSGGPSRETECKKENGDADHGIHKDTVRPFWTLICPLGYSLMRRLLQITSVLRIESLGKISIAHCALAKQHLVPDTCPEVFTCHAGMMAVHH